MARQRTTEPRTARFLISLTPDERQRVKIKAVTEGVAMGAIAHDLLLAWANSKPGGELDPLKVSDD